jgi:hypothetical protein
MKTLFLSLYQFDFSLGENNWEKFSRDVFHLRKFSTNFFVQFQSYSYV